MPKPPTQISSMPSRLETMTKQSTHVHADNTAPKQNKEL